MASKSMTVLDHIKVRRDTQVVFIAVEAKISCREVKQELVAALGQEAPELEDIEIGILQTPDSSVAPLPTPDQEDEYKTLEDGERIMDQCVYWRRKGEKYQVTTYPDDDDE